MRQTGFTMAKLGRLTLVAVLCLDVYACGVRPGRDLSMSGAIDKFDERRAATRAEAARLDAESLGLSETGNRRGLKPLPQRRELLQVRVPASMTVDDIADGVVATSIAGAVATQNAAISSSDRAASPSQPLNQRVVESQIKALDGQILVLEKEMRALRADYEREKLLLDQIDMRHAKTRDLMLQGFKIANEELLQTKLSELNAKYGEVEPTTVLGLTENTELAQLALFGRNELARPDEYVSLEKSFIFVGNDVTTGISLGRMDDVADEIGSRTLSVNLKGLRLPTALRSLARSIGLQIYLSPLVGATSQKISLDIARADALDVFDILIDNYGLVMAYDRKMSIARFYTREEFSARVEEAVMAAEQHNRRARNYRRINALESDAAELRQIYKAYFQHPDDAGRARSLTNDAIIEMDRSSEVAAAIVEFKKQALANETALDELDRVHAEERQSQASVTLEAKFMVDDAVQSIALRQADRDLKIADLAEIKLTAAKDETDTSAFGAPDVPDMAEIEVEQNDAPMQRFVAGPNAEILRGRIIKDANLKTTSPIYTEKFTIYNSEGGSTCNAEGGDRADAIKSQLTDYFAQLYPDELIAAETDAERRAERNAARARNRNDEDNTDMASAGIGDIATDAAIEGDAPLQPAPDATSEPAPETEEVEEGGDEAGPRLTDAGFRRPTVTNVAESVIITGFKHDVDLAASLIENLDKPDKQVLVEVFMVNVVKNWQRQLQGRLQNALRLDSKTDPDVAAISDADQAQLPGLIEVRNGGLIGVRGALNFANRAAAANSFTLNNFRLGLAWTVDFMETNSLGRKVSSPTILALDGCPAKIEKSETRYLPITTTSAPVVTPGGQTVPGEITTTYEPRQAQLKLEVTPDINPLNDHVKLKVAFNDDFFVSSDPNSDKIQSVINTEFISAPGDVIVLAGLYTEDNSKTRNGLPGTTGLPLVSSIFGTTSDAQNTQEMVIFLAPEVITPDAAQMPVNSAAYYDAR